MGDVNKVLRLAPLIVLAVLLALAATSGTKAAAQQGPDFGEEPDGGPIIYNLLPGEGETVERQDLSFASATIEVQHDLYIKSAEIFIDGEKRPASLLGPYAYLQTVGADVTDLSPGKHTARVVATDSEGRRGGYTWSFTVTGDRGYTQVVDNSDPARFSASDNWGFSSWSAGRYLSNYRYATPNTSFSDPASYSFNIPATDEYAVYARWPADRGYNPATPVGVKTASGLQWTTVDQTKNGGRWNYLGTYKMTGGSEDKVLFSRWSPAEGYIVADAVKLERR